MTRNATLGTTETGKDWCIKALHPSDPTTEIRGIPDESAVSSAFLNYQSTFSLTAAPAAVGTWSFDATLLPHPVNFMHLEHTDSTGSQVENFMNTQLTGVTHSNKFETFLGMCRRWRLAYMSVTVYQDGPDLANQGTMVATQVPVSPVHYTWSYVFGAPLCRSETRLAVYSALDRPHFDNMQAMPNAYFNKSKEGCYLPLKLTKTCQDWHSVSDVEMQHWETLPDDVCPPIMEGELNLPSGPGPIAGSFPHVNLNAAQFDTVLGRHGQVTSCMCNDVFGQISARNVSVQTGFSFFVRAGFEVQVQPGSVLSSSLKLSPPHDSLAIDCYFAICRELKDAYPADYNDLGKIWDVISSIAKTVAPFLAPIPGIGGLLSGAISGGTALGDRIRQAVAAKNAQSMKTVLSRPAEASSAQIAAVKKMVHAPFPKRPPPPPPTQRKIPGKYNVQRKRV